MRHAFRVSGDVGLANALRRTLISDLKNWAPHEVTFRENTSCQTDEYIAHRLGLMPFRRVGNGHEMTLKKQGGVAVAGDMVSLAFEAVHPALPLMDLGSDAVLDLTVHLNEGKPSQHARYSTCTAVGMRRLDDGAYEISFELHDPRRSATDVFLAAVDALDARIDECLRQLARQPVKPPMSRCG